MKIVAKRTVKMQVDSYIDDLEIEGLEILRIELSRKEFVEMWDSCCITPGVNDFNIYWRSVGKDKVPTTGSYLIYRNICVQYHEDYKSGDLGVEYL